MYKVASIANELQNGDYPFVFLGGIHGVGKTYFCEREFVKIGYICITASSLIRSYGAQSDHNKRVGNITDNQLALVEQLAIEKEHSERLILDGHYCLLDHQSNVEAIDIKVFREINPNLFILIKGNPLAIADRLKLRDGKNWCPKFVDAFQDQEEEHAKYVSNKMNVPLKIVKV